MEVSLPPESNFILSNIQVSNLLSWHKPQSTAKLVLIVNLFFLLMIVFGYSLLSLLLLFVFFLALAGMALNLIYLSSREDE